MEKDRNLKYVVVSIVIAVISAIIALPFDYRISVGIIVGIVASICNYMILSAQMSLILMSGKFNVISYAIVYLIRYGLLFIPLVLAVLRPDRCNVWAVFGSLFIFKVVMYFEGLRKKVL